MASLICGSIAYDTIMTYEGRFRDHILPEQIHILNVSFLVPQMRREFGGCAGNIAYTLKMLGGEPMVMATVGGDADPYLAHLRQLDISVEHVRVLPEQFTAQAMVTTDLDNNQITAFHPGAMTYSAQNRIDQASGFSLGIVAPDGRDGMLEHARQFSDLGVPFVFDPGQGMPMFDGADLRHFVELANYVAVNDYEGRMLTERTGLSLEQIASQVEALIVTLGEHGVEIYAGGKRYMVPGIKPTAVVDPTGCGDAFRGGLLYGIEQGFDWETIGRLANLMGSLKIAKQGPQNHAISRDAIHEQFNAAFGYRYE